MEVGREVLHSRWNFEMLHLVQVSQALFGKDGEMGGKVKEDKPGSYPSCIEEHVPSTQYPNTPKLTPL